MAAMVIAAAGEPGDTPLVPPVARPRGTAEAVLPLSFDIGARERLRAIGHRLHAREASDTFEAQPARPLSITAIDDERQQLRFGIKPRRSPRMGVDYRVLFGRR